MSSDINEVNLYLNNIGKEDSLKSKLKALSKEKIILEKKLSMLNEKISETFLSLKQIRNVVEETRE